MNPKQEKGAAKGAYRQEGSIGDLLSVMLCILGMTVVMSAFLDCVNVVNRKTMVGQLARNYVLRMETVGYLAAEDELALRRELESNDVSDVSLNGTTREPVSYGAEITLRIEGRIGGKHVFEETRVSTAKH